MIQEGKRRIKGIFECLLRGETIHSLIDEQIVYNWLWDNEAAVWSLLLGSGYLKVLSYLTEQICKYGFAFEGKRS
ncbi:MAG: hypothetical protein K2J90_01920 [Lachnospiraceae bacterium]|nr:hypothetical protein [Lachnospiraceae bacterium]